MTTSPDSRDPAGYQLRFEPLFRGGRQYAFPCDRAGHVDMNSLSRRALNDYLYARAVVGHEFYLPVTQRAAHA
jgi:hypothetical protein